MFPEISDYLKSTLGGTISNILQPDKIAAATIFLLLNLVDIVVSLGRFNAPAQRLLNDFLSFNSALQVVLVTALILALGYLLLSFNTAFYKLFTGESWMDSLPGKWLVNNQKQERDRLCDASNRKDQASLLKRQKLITSFAKEEAYVYPTSLGNVQNATASYIWHHYGVDMAALWPHMDSTLAGVNKELMGRIDSEKAALDFLVNMTFLLVLFAVELIVQSFFLQTQLSVLLALIPLFLARITYLAATNKARTWGDVVQMAFDFHRDDLRKHLSIRPFTSEEDEREVWQRVSSLFLWGVPADDVFAIGASDSKGGSPSGGGASSDGKASDGKSGAKDSPDSGASSDGKKADKAIQQVSDPAATAICKVLSNADNVQAELQSAVVTLDTPQHWMDSPPNVLQAIDQYIDYLLVVTIKKAAGNGHPQNQEKPANSINPATTTLPTTSTPPPDVLLAVSDQRLQAIYKKPIPRDINNELIGQNKDSVNIEATIFGDPGMFNSQGQIIWTITSLATGNTKAFRYRLPSHAVFTATIQEKKLRIEEEQTSSNPAFITDSGLETSNTTLMSKETFCADTGTIDYRIVFRANDQNIEEGTMLEIYDSRLSRPGAKKYGCLWLGDDAVPRILQAVKLSSPDRYFWRLPKIEKDTLATLTYTV
jgi:hypothetical protein